jgi:membrane peptidoglycan carboxypeptidase
MTTYRFVRFGIKVLAALLFVILITPVILGITSGWQHKAEVMHKIEKGEVYHYMLADSPLSRQVSIDDHLYRDTPRNNFHGKDLKNLENYPERISKLVVDSEDEKLYEHNSTANMVFNTVLRSVTSLGRAGGSGLSQQLARTLINLSDSSINIQKLELPSFLDKIYQKVREIIVAEGVNEGFKKLYPEKNQDIDHILLAYMNNVYLGENIYGFVDAARVYYGLNVNQLSLDQQATLVAMLSQPNAYTCPQSKKEQSKLPKKLSALKRIRDHNLDKAAKLNHINAGDVKIAKNKAIVFNNLRCTGKDEIPYFAQVVNEQLKKLAIDKSVKRGSVTTTTTLNFKKQLIAERILEKAIENYGDFGLKSGALVSMDIDTGKVRTMASVSDHKSFNIITQAHRHPGSIAKLFTYITALEQGINPTDQFSCSGFDWPKGRYFLPACRSHFSPINLYMAVSSSENTIAYRVAQQVGMKNVVKTAYRLGISPETKLNPDYYGTVIGQGKGSDVTPLEMLRAYATVANHGVMPSIQLIDNVSDTRRCDDPVLKLGCKKLLRSSEIYQPGKRVLTPKVADDMDLLLRGVVNAGTGQLAKIEVLPDAAAKTGTNGVSNNSRDLWFVGYSRSQNTITLVWLGNRDEQKEKGTVIRSEDLSQELKGHLGAKVWKQYTMATLKKDLLPVLPKDAAPTTAKTSPKAL